ncbi:Flagellar motor switch protein [Rhodovulum sp. P5]|uniref:flagellar motor switch protein FliM n=1 Tax=Rhodovulum sp. P5 TaxID=1564506 RepID=UPI0009C21F7B|nr:flagellar motor switch protein FliM [Rhodovulum sp. P5]ARE38386.1 Flagellar motor switch protein [Rhodovulum sp. P5]
MGNEAHSAILRRILEAAAAEDSAGKGRKSRGGHGKPEVSILRLEAARMAREAFGITAIIDSLEVLNPTLEELEAEVSEEGGLPVLLNGPDGRMGLAVYTPELALALLEWRLLAFLGSEEPSHRPLTATDGAVLADFLDPLLARFGTALEEETGAEWPCGYSQGTRIDDPRHVQLTLADVPYRGFRVGLKLGPGTRGGKFFLALPEIVKKDALAGDGHAHAVKWSDSLKTGVLGAELTIQGVLMRTRVNAATVSRWKVGDTVALPADALSSIKLEGPGGVFVAEGRLGQMKGDRAVKIDGAGGDDGDDAGMMQLPAAAAAEPMDMALPEPDFGSDFPALDDGEGLELDTGMDLPMDGFPAMDGDGEDFDFAAMAPLDDQAS